jgi:hypothetical protein
MEARNTTRCCHIQVHAETSRVGAALGVEVAVAVEEVDQDQGKGEGRAERKVEGYMLGMELLTMGRADDASELCVLSVLFCFLFFFLAALNSGSSPRKAEEYMDPRFQWILSLSQFQSFLKFLFWATLRKGGGLVAVIALCIHISKGVGAVSHRSAERGKRKKKMVWLA